ncbi:DUF5994 family protein [Streptomyces thermodiastaticus]|uniref:DUF5994 family protein n=2 Tax=Streptomyces thermodiastaticus TaxID=44061 RepID=UPI0027E4A5ED|nr:DUF5994 family protein [Streptomyces thermodiastaticus]
MCTGRGRPPVGRPGPEGEHTWSHPAFRAGCRSSVNTPGVLRAPAPPLVPFPVIDHAGPHRRARGQARVMPVTIDRTASSRRTPQQPARLSLTPAPGGLDGMWWPRSRALTRELPTLTAALSAHWGRITGVTVHPAHWPVVPHWVSVAGRTVQVSCSTEVQDPHRLTVSLPDGRRDVLVIPPETGADAAAHLMAGDDGDAAARKEAADRIDARTREEAWETDGGAGRAVVPDPAHRVGRALARGSAEVGEP